MRTCRLLPLLLAGLAATALGCADPCSPIRCGLVPPVLLTVRAADTGQLLAEATVLLEGDPGDYVSPGCTYSGERFGCTHEILDIAGNDELKRPDEGVEPGRGPWQEHVRLTATVTAEAPGFESAVLAFEVDTDACGMPVPIHREVRLTPLGHGREPETGPLEAPRTCRESR